MSARPPRRNVVIGALGITGTALAGCSLSNEPGSPRGAYDLPGTPGSSQRDVELQLAAIAAERRLISGAQQVLRAHPQLARILRPIIADHTEHLSALGGRRSAAERSPRAGSVPATVRPALAGLASAEDAAADDRIQDCVAAGSGTFAGLLASIGAAESQHAWG